MSRDEAQLVGQRPRSWRRARPRTTTPTTADRRRTRGPGPAPAVPGGQQREARRPRSRRTGTARPPAPSGSAGGSRGRAPPSLRTSTTPAASIPERDDDPSPPAARGRASTTPGDAARPATGGRATSASCVTNRRGTCAIPRSRPQLLGQRAASPSRSAAGRRSTQRSIEAPDHRGDGDERRAAQPPRAVGRRPAPQPQQPGQHPAPRDAAARNTSSTGHAAAGAPAPRGAAAHTTRARNGTSTYARTA